MIETNRGYLPLLRLLHDAGGRLGFDDHRVAELSLRELKTAVLDQLVEFDVSTAEGCYIVLTPYGRNQLLIDVVAECDACVLQGVCAVDWDVDSDALPQVDWDDLCYAVDTDPISSVVHLGRITCEWRGVALPAVQAGDYVLACGDRVTVLRIKGA